MSTPRHNGRKMPVFRKRKPNPSRKTAKAGGITRRKRRRSVGRRPNGDFWKIDQINESTENGKRRMKNGGSKQ